MKDVKRKPGRFLIECALVLSALFLIAHLAGFRAHTSVLSGVHAGESWMLYAGVLYLLLYAIWMSVAPILGIAGALLWMEDRFRQQKTPNDPVPPEGDPVEMRGPNT